jgi:tRNA(fMet)-specific endonuclease VapC
MKRRLLLDANHLSAAVNPRLTMIDWLGDAHQRGWVFGTCLPVLAELEAGFQQTGHVERNRRTLGTLRQWIRLWPLDETASRVFGEIHAELRRAGRSLSMTDIFLAALCRQMNLTLLTADRDFEALPDLRVENWLSRPPAAST